MDFEFQNDREIMISLAGKIERLGEIIEGFSESMTNLKQIEIKDLATRITKLEHRQSEQDGVIKFLGSLSLGLGILSALVTLVLVFK